MSDTSSKTTTITIKKYANRRLYNTATSSYVTLEDLSAMVKEGMDFAVYDAKTSEDITRSVLTQIIVEEESKSGQQSLLPISFLRQLIGFYGDSLQWMVPKYLEQSMESLTGNHGRIQEYFQNSFSGIFPFGTTIEEMSKQNMAMFERAMQMFSLFPVGLTMAPCDTTTCVASPSSICSCPPSAGTKTKSSSPMTYAPPSAPVTMAKPSCPMTSEAPMEMKATSVVKEEEVSKTPSPITSLKPRNENPAPKVTPMPSVQASTASSGADDMQQKIANLQRQLADLAKSRA